MRLPVPLSMALLLLAAGGCRPEAPAPVPLTETGDGAATVTTGIDTLAASLVAADAAITGAVVLTSDDGALILAAAIDGLMPGAYAIHIHENSVCTGTGADRAGPRLSLPGDAERLAARGQPPAGAFGGFDVGGNGQAKFSIEKSGVVGPARFLGRTVVVHAGADSAAGEPTGRLVACGALKPIAR